MALIARSKSGQTVPRDERLVIRTGCGIAPMRKVCHQCFGKMVHAQDVSEPARLLLLVSLLAKDRLISHNGKGFLKELLLRRDPSLLKVFARFGSSETFLEDLQDLIDRESQRVFDELFVDVPLSEGKTLSKMERKRKGWLDDKALIYGEVEFSSFAMILREVATLTEPGRAEVFYDLGSGTGKAVFLARLTQDFAHCVGIELLEPLHAAAERVTERYNTKFRRYLDSARPQNAAVYSGSFLEYDWSDGDVVFANSTCFPDKLMEELARQAEELKPGSVVVTFTKGLESPCFEIVDKKRLDMSWGPATVIVHRRRPLGNDASPESYDNGVHDADCDQNSDGSTIYGSERSGHSEAPGDFDGDGSEAADRGPHEDGGPHEISSGEIEGDGSGEEATGGERRGLTEGDGQRSERDGPEDKDEPDEESGQAYGPRGDCDVAKARGKGVHGEGDNGDGTQNERASDIVFDAYKFKGARCGGEEITDGDEGRFVGFGELLRQAELAQEEAVQGSKISREELMGLLPGDDLATIDSGDDRLLDLEESGSGESGVNASSSCKNNSERSPAGAGAIAVSCVADERDSEEISSEHPDKNIAMNERADKCCQTPGAGDELACIAENAESVRESDHSADVGRKKPLEAQLAGDGEGVASNGVKRVDPREDHQIVDATGGSSPRRRSEGQDTSAEDGDGHDLSDGDIVAADGEGDDIVAIAAAAAEQRGEIRVYSIDTAAIVATGGSDSGSSGTRTGTRSTQRSPAGASSDKIQAEVQVDRNSIASKLSSAQEARDIAKGPHVDGETAGNPNEPPPPPLPDCSAQALEQRNESCCALAQPPDVPAKSDAL